MHGPMNVKKKTVLGVTTA